MSVTETASAEPSGDQQGLPADMMPGVSRSTCPPPATPCVDITQSSEPNGRRFSRSTLRSAVKATQRPSGETTG